MWCNSANYYEVDDVISDGSERSISDTEIQLPWIERYYDALVELYTVYKETGCKLFGPAFNQFGDFGTFCRNVQNNIGI